VRKNAVDFVLCAAMLAGAVAIVVTGSRVWILCLVALSILLLARNLTDLRSWLLRGRS
jgi:hypothetical protein